MPLSASSNEGRSSAAFNLLHPKVQRWVWDQGWSSLHEVQEAAIPAILEGRGDVLIAAPTAGGKTEAAFLPICSQLVDDARGSIRVLCVSPLKALINDQYDRLDLLCEHLDIPVHRWHGDVPASRKHSVLGHPSGVLLITPESLEAIFVLHGPRVGRLLDRLAWVVVDELHAFIGSERGRQLQSLLHRVELQLGRAVPRVALSATIGDLRLAAEFLRPAGGDTVRIVHSDGTRQEIKLQLRGYLERPPDADGGNPKEPDEEPPAANEIAIATQLFEVLRGQDNLVFVNSRRDAERYADLLRQMCEQARLPVEFFPHHGSLSRDLRQDVEALLKDKGRPATAICTTTLELGIDIGSVASTAQIGAPPSVASLRQRLGRSGRRGGPAVMRLYVQEAAIELETPPQDTLRPELVQTIAMVELLRQRWYEPPRIGALHLSTLSQQLLSIIAERGGARPVDAWAWLCRDGPFKAVDEAMFVQFVRSLGRSGLVTQANDGTLFLGEQGERRVNHYSFYTAFITPEEYRLEADGRVLGTLPVAFAVLPGMYLIFGGRRWRVIHVDSSRRVIALEAASGGRAPRFSGGGALVHDRVRKEMLAVYESDVTLAYLDAAALGLLGEARASFSRLGLGQSSVVAHGKDSLVFPWAGDSIMDTLVLFLRGCGLDADRDGICICVRETAPASLWEHLSTASTADLIDVVALARGVANKQTEKWDWALSDELLAAEYASRRLDGKGMQESVGRLRRRP